MKGPLIGRGRTAGIFAWGDGAVLKLFRPELPRSLGEREWRIASTVERTGVPCPRVLGSRVEDGRFGILYERLDGPTMIESLRAKPWTAASLARTLADLQARIHAAPGDGLPSFKESMLRAVRAAPHLEDREKDAVAVLMEELPEGTALCHGDLHPDNVLLSCRGPVVIDWMTAARGAPAADFARSSYLMRDAALPPGMPPAARLSILAMRRLILGAYTGRYRRLMHPDPAAVEAWRLPVAAARLTERNPPEETRRLLAFIRGGLGRGPSIGPA